MPRANPLPLVLGLLAALLAGCPSPGGDADGDGDSDADGDGDRPDADQDTGDDADADGEPEASCPEGYELGDFAGKPVFPVTINGEGPFDFVWDTGAPTSGMDLSVAALLGSGPHDLSLAGHEVEDVSLPAMDMTAMLGTPGVDGVLGTSVMGRFVVTIDRGRSRYWLDMERDDASLLACDHVAADPVDVEVLRTYYLYVQGSAEDRPGWFLLDSGASLGAMPDTVFDELQGARERPALEGFHTPAAIGTFWARLTAIGSLEVGGHEVGHIITRTIDDDMIPAPSFTDEEPFLGLLPNGFLRHFLVTVDYAGETLRLDPYVDDSMREPSTYFVAGIGLEAEEAPPIHVAQVLAGSSAEEQGVLVGDEVVSISGWSMEYMSPSQRAWGLVSDVDGDDIGVVLRRGEEELSLELETRDLRVDP